MGQNEVKPTQSQLEWHNLEIGVLIHYDINVFEPEYNFRKQWGYTPDPSVFNPKFLDTDQWIETAKSAGAKYAILVVKHCTGFCLWPSKNYNYSVATSPYKEGKGDIVRDFVNSCHKFGLKPGFYYSTVCNAYMEYDKPGKRPISQDNPEFVKYKELLEQQLSEIWGNYGDLFELWFDGGHVDGGPDIIALLKKYQPNANCFQGPKKWPSNIRWVGNERGFAPYPCWSTIDNIDHYDGTKEIGDKHCGNKTGKIWMPAETDTPNRYMRWFWKKNEEYLIKPAELLLRHYYESVGRNSNLLLGMVIDTNGLVPEEDVKQFSRFGRLLREQFSEPIYQTLGKIENNEFIIELENPEIINQVLLQEDITEGHKIYKFQLFMQKFNANNELTSWKLLNSGSCIGHKRIIQFNSEKIKNIKLKILESSDIPEIKDFALYHVNPLPKVPSLIKNFVKYLFKRLKKLFIQKV